MNIFSRLFGSSDEDKAKYTVRLVKDEVRESLKPLGDISLAIVKASYACALQMNWILNIPDEKEKKEIEDLVFYEFVYFFIHLTMRSAFAQLYEQQIKRLQDYLVPLISSTAVDSFFAQWPEDLKEKIKSEFYDKLNDAELEYSTCKELFSEKNPMTGNSLFSKLARNIAELSGNSMNPAVLTLVISSGVDAYKEMQLDLFVKKAGMIL